MANKYIVDEDTLLNLIASREELNYLEENGVDNWLGYSEGRGEYIKTNLEFLTEQAISLDKVYDESLDMRNIAEIKIKDYPMYQLPVFDLPMIDLDAAFEDDLK